MLTSKSYSIFCKTKYNEILLSIKKLNRRNLLVGYHSCDSTHTTSPLCVSQCTKKRHSPSWLFLISMMTIFRGGIPLFSTPAKQGVHIINEQLNLSMLCVLYNAFTNFLLIKRAPPPEKALFLLFLSYYQEKCNGLGLTYSMSTRHFCSQIVRIIIPSYHVRFKCQLHITVQLLLVFIH